MENELKPSIGVVRKDVTELIAQLPKRPAAIFAPEDLEPSFDKGFDTCTTVKSP